jgi:tetratricopeptide (TPR) repeat protein
MILKMNYKRVLYLFLVIAMPLVTFGKGDVRALFDKGNQLYAKAHYKEAVTAYQQVINSGYQSAGVYFNMGNAFYKTDDIPSAIWYYEKAHKLLPGDEDINFNIRFANLKTADRIDEAPEFFLTKWWHNFILMFSLSALSALSITFILIGFLLLIGYLFTGSVVLKKASFYTSIGLFVLGLITILMGNRQAAYFDNHKQAIIFSGSVTVKSTPATAAKTLFLLHAGTKVNVLETNAGHVKIKLANGSEGWISSADVKEI